MGFNLGEILPLKLPQNAKVTNNRLACLQLTVQLLVVFLLLGYFFSARLYVKTLLPEGKVNSWGSREGKTEFDAAVAKDEASPICQKGTDAQKPYGFYYDDFFNHHE